MNKEITAKLSYLRISPRKARVVSDLIKGKKVHDALAQLVFMAKRSASPIAKLLKSAINNAKNELKTENENDLIIKNITVNSGPVLKRQRPRSRGMANQIKKRTSHITITVSEKTKLKEKKPEIKGKK